MCFHYPVFKNCIWSRPYCDSLILNSCLAREKDNEEVLIFTQKWHMEVSRSSEMAPVRAFLEKLISAKGHCPRGHCVSPTGKQRGFLLHVTKGQRPLAHSP